MCAAGIRLTTSTYNFGSLVSANKSPKAGNQKQK